MSAEASSRRHLLDGATRVFLGEALFFPTGLLVVAFLTRRLGPEGYGVLALTMAPVLWIEWSVAALFSRATVKLAGDAEDWRPVGAAIVRLHLAAGVLAGVLLAAFAGPVAALLGEPALAGYLRLFALDVPLMTVIHAHRGLLVGTGGFRPRAVAAAARWIARLLLIVALVEAGFSVTGAILGNIGASLVELAVVRSAIRPPLLGRAPLNVGPLWTYATPLFVSAASLRLFDRLDLFVYKALGASTELAGIYGAAQNLALAPRIFNVSLSTLLLATLTQMLRIGQGRAAADLSRDAERFGLALLPLAGIAAGSAPELVGLVFGETYAPAAPLLALLLFATIASVQMSIATAVLTAGGKPGWTVWLAWPLVPLAAAGHLLAIPRFGAAGAAFVTSACAALGAAACVLAVRRVWGVAPPLATLGRSALLTVCAYLAAAAWSSPGPWVLLKMGILVAGVVAGFAALGEVGLGRRPPAWRVLLPDSGLYGSVSGPRDDLDRAPQARPARR
ncbi:MAG: oligosaccharide flippase family protein [Armatimonadota bacterium]|nr:oligosaccharide flippase family protein [Armatimonadota bacterium]